MNGNNLLKDYIDKSAYEFCDIEKVIYIYDLDTNNKIIEDSKGQLIELSKSKSKFLTDRVDFTFSEYNCCVSEIF